ncbi:MAG: alpha-galactosidase [Acidobacteria bacterium]|nr:alpha-galactosidase [Acidobacteriota bacterium]
MAAASLAAQEQGEERVWTVSNDVITARYRLAAATERFRLESIVNNATGDVWTVPADADLSPINFSTSTGTIDGRTPMRLVESRLESIARGGSRTRIVLRDTGEQFEFTLDLEVWPRQPALRQSLHIVPLGRAALIRAVDFMPWQFSGAGGSFRTYQVNQWAIIPQPVNFEPVETKLSPEGIPQTVSSGSGAPQCAWLALRDRQDRGLFWGWEFDGRAKVSIQHDAQQDRITVTSAITELNHPVAAGETFEVPASFIGTFQGDWDEAGYGTQRFAEAAIAATAPDGVRFPYAVWDSWGYQKEIDEVVLRRNAELAAQAGLELFVVDLGWAPQIGDWVEDPKKFPSGLRALSDYVHSLGMKFGLHFVPTEAAPESAVLQEHPDWVSSETYYYHGAVSLCPGHKPVREWVLKEVLKIIDNYNVDWILQDGQTLVKYCNRTDHTHAADDSNYSNSVDGIDWIVAEARRLRPNTVWENCANGGSMMTFQMLRNYVTSITNDASGSLGARQGMFGATFPFPPRYADRYMPDSKLNSYVTRSFMFGGPWVFMNRLPEMPEEDLRFAQTEISRFKGFRDEVRDGKIFHLTPRPEEGVVDAVQTVEEGEAVAVVTRDQSASPNFVLRLRGLNDGLVYIVTFADDPRVLTMTGRQLMGPGIPINFDQSRDAEIVYARPLPQ